MVPFIILLQVDPKYSPNFILGYPYMTIFFIENSTQVFFKEGPPLMYMIYSNVSR